MMHSKETVWYICEEYVRTGRKFYWKRELLTTDSYRNLDSVYWSDRKPISARTFRKAEREGYKCDYVRIYTPPAEVYQFEGRKRDDRGAKDGAAEHAPRGCCQVIGLLQRRLRKSLGLRRMSDL